MDGGQEKKVWSVESLLEGRPGTVFCPRVGVSGSSRRQKLECLHGIVLWASAGRGLGREGEVNERGAWLSMGYFFIQL